MEESWCLRQKPLYSRPGGLVAVVRPIGNAHYLEFAAKRLLVDLDRVKVKGIVHVHVLMSQIKQNMICSVADAESYGCYTRHAETLEKRRI